MRRSIIIPGSHPHNSVTSFVASTNSIVVVGANGSGKSRFGAYIEDLNRDVHRITAQKSLVMPEDVTTKPIDKAQKDFLYGASDIPNNQTEEWLKTIGKKSYKYQNRPTTHLISDFHSLMSLLFSDEFSVSLQFRESFKAGDTNPQNVESKLDKLIAIWQEVLPNRVLIKSSTSIQVASTILTHMVGDHSFYQSVQYKGVDMSDGERVIFYLIGEAICTLPESILIIDEPELHIHKSIIKRLFDKIELVRPDVLFVYLTHDIDFAISRTGADKIWLQQSLSPYSWKYEFIKDFDVFPEQIYLEILGSRRPILFVEGDKNSIDFQLYSLLFSASTVTPVGSCTKVIESTKAFNDAKNFHHLNAKGIIDRDRRTDSEISAVEKNNISVLKVSEVENLFLLEEVVKMLANRMGKNGEEVFNKVKKNIISAFEQELEKQTTEHTIHIYKRQVANSIDSTQNWVELEKGLQDSFDVNKYHVLYNSFKLQFQSYIDNGDYLSILKYANMKKLVLRSDLAKLCELQNSGDAIRNLLLFMIKSGGVESQKVRDAILTMIY